MSVLVLKNSVFSSGSLLSWFRSPAKPQADDLAVRRILGEWGYRDRYGADTAPEEAKLKAITAVRVMRGLGWKPPQ